MLKDASEEWNLNRMEYKSNYNKALYIIKCYSDRYEDANPSEEDWRDIIENHSLEELKEVMEADEKEELTTRQNSNW